MRRLAFLFFAYLIINPSPTLSFEPVPFSINTKKWSHVLDDHFISITVNPTDLLQGKVFGLTMNSTMAILKGLAPAYVRIGSADTAKYTFKKTRYPNDMVKPEDEYTVTETHWMVFNEVLQSAGLDVVVCLNAAHRIEGTKKWDTRNSLELISFSDSQGYNLTWQLGYEIQSGEELSGIQFGKDLNRLRTILNAFPRYQNSKLIGPDIKIIHKKEDIDFWNDVLLEAGPTIYALTWHPRWPQPSKMKVSENSELGYEFPIDYLEWDRNQLNKILQKSVFKNPVWIGETKRESTGTFAEGLIWARRLVLAAKLGIEVVMKQPNLMDVTHPKPEYWIALLHKRLLGKAVLETRSLSNGTDLTVISHCASPYFWADKPEKLQDGPITVFGVNMGGLEQKIQIRGPTWTGRSQLLFQYVLTSGSDPDSIFSQMTYLNGEPLMMTDEGLLPDIVPKIKKLEKGLTMKLPPYSVGFWVVPEAKVKICQVSTQNLPLINIESLTPSIAHKSPTTSLKNIEDINQFIVEKLKNPESESEEVPQIKIEIGSSESSEKEINLMPLENSLPRIVRRIRRAKTESEDFEQLKKLMHETQQLLMEPQKVRSSKPHLKTAKPSSTIEHRIYSIAEGISDAMKSTNQQKEFDKFLEDSGLKQDFGTLLVNDRRMNAPGVQNLQMMQDTLEGNRLRRSIYNQEETEKHEKKPDDLFSKEQDNSSKFDKKIYLVDEGADEVEEEPISDHQQDLVIPHQPDLKGLEEKYKTILQIKLENGKRKIDDVQKKIKQETDEISQKINSEGDVAKLEEEIIKKEIELISKTEETVADIFNNQKKRQETFEDIIFDELNDVKGEKINALVEIQRNHKKNENAIRKRQTPGPLTKPLMKTVEYIEKNFNLEPESVRKIKRSLEEKMGEILRNYDTKKNTEGKKRIVTQKEDRRHLRKQVNEDDTSQEKRDRRLDSSTLRNIERERIKERNFEKKQVPTSLKPQSGNIRSSKRYYLVDEDDGEPTYVERKEESYRSRKIEGEPMYKTKKLGESSVRSRKYEETPYTSYYKIRKNEESLTKSRKSDDTNKKVEEIKDDSFEFFNAKPFEIPSSKKSDRRQQLKEKDGKTLRITKKTSMESPKYLTKSWTKAPIDHETTRRTQKPVARLESEEMETMDESEEEMIDEKPEIPVVQNIPLKQDKDRRANMLKQITSMVENMNSMEVGNRDRLKRMGYDEDLSTEFEPDRKTSGIMRRPREADDSQYAAAAAGNFNQMPTNIMPLSGLTGGYDEVQMMEQMKSLKPYQGVDERMENFQTMQQSSPTQMSRLSRLRRLRKRPSRRMRAQMKEEREESIQKKRHLAGPERPLMDLERHDRKKLFKSKLRKINPKFLRTDYEPLESQMPVNLIKEEEMVSSNAPQNIASPLIGESSMTIDVTEQPQTRIMAIAEQPNELMKDLKEIVEEQHFLGEGSGIEQKELKTSGSKYSGTKESSIITTEEAITESMQTPTVMLQQSEALSSNQEKEKSMGKAVTENSEPMIGATMKPAMETSKQKYDVNNESKNIKKMTSETSCTTSAVQSGPIGSPSSEESSQEEKNESTNWAEEEAMSEEIGNEYEKSWNRKRRATFLQNRKELNQETKDEDYSSEERIKKFKQMIYKRGGSSNKNFPAKNDIGKSIGADEFFKMAGSTVRVVFDDVIPEAYGQTKMKIQNMGLSEYIKEFGHLVEQMRNLDQIFLNIGEAAVKGYIRGNKAEKGPYIQVISRKKRALAENDMKTNEMNEDAQIMGKTISTEEEGTCLSKMSDLGKPKAFQTDMVMSSTTLDPEIFRPGKKSEGNEHKTIKKEEKISGNRLQSNNDVSQLRGRIIENFHSSTQTRETTDPEPETEITTRLQTTAETEKNAETTPQTIEKLKDNTPPIYPALSDVKEDPIMNIQVTESSSESKKSDIKAKTEFKNRKLSNIDPKSTAEWLNSYIKDDLRQNITPWIKTTKDFIHQALTTLQRQRQLSEILTRDGINLLKSETKKSIEKRDASAEEPSLPVYHMIKPNANKKRDTNSKVQSDETLIRHLRELQPGVYVVPTEDMTNVRSEQITSEPSQKSGLPNVVTLNIYYDKKNQDGKDKADDNQSSGEPRISHDTVTYYQNKGWTSVAGHYNQNNQFVSPVQEMQMTPAMVAPVQMGQVYSPDPRISDVPNPRMVQYPSSGYTFPPAPKVISTVVPNPHPVYGPVLYVQPEMAYIPQSPGTKRHWRDFKVPGSGTMASNLNSGWNLQYGSLPSASRKAPRNKLIPNPNFKVVGDKKRSIAYNKINPTWSEPALPFWKFFTDSSSEEMENSKESVESKESKNKQVTNSGENISGENNGRAKETVKIAKPNAVKAVEKVSEEKDNQNRKKRSLARAGTESEKTSGDEVDSKIVKRSYPYTVDFEDHDDLPQWFDNYYELDETMDELLPHIRRSHIASTPWSAEEEQLLSTIIEAEDEFGYLNGDYDMNNDYYTPENNVLTRLSRSPRSTDAMDSAMLKTNMIFKSSMENDLMNQKLLGYHNLADKEKSWEVISKPMVRDNINSTNVKKQIEQEIENKIRHHIQQQYSPKIQASPSPSSIFKPQQTSQNGLQDQQPSQSQAQTKQPQEPTQQLSEKGISIPNSQTPSLQQILQSMQLQSMVMQNSTDSLSSVPNDDSLYYFFKYAYDSFIKVMKSMAQLF